LVRLSKALYVSKALQVQEQLLANQLKNQLNVRYQKAEEVTLKVEKCRMVSEELEAKFAELDASLK